MSLDDYYDQNCDTRPDLKDQVERLTVRGGLNRGFHMELCDNPAEMRHWHRVVISLPYGPEEVEIRDSIMSILYPDHEDDQDERNVIMSRRWLYEPKSTRTIPVNMGNNQIAMMPVKEPTIQDYEFYVRDDHKVMSLQLMWPNIVKVWRGDTRLCITESVYDDLFG